MMAQQGQVNEIFNRVVMRYDLMNDLMSFGLQRLWKSVFVGRLSRSNHRNIPFCHLDVASGTGDIALRIARRLSKADRISVTDVNSVMLVRCKNRLGSEKLDPRLIYTQADGASLPFVDNHFDAYTIAFGLRNVPDRHMALQEAWRVLKPGGQFLCLEFSHCQTMCFQELYNSYSRLIPLLGQIVVGDADPYHYLIESIKSFPTAEELVQMMQEVGFYAPNYMPMTGGIVAIHSGWKI